MVTTTRSERWSERNPRRAALDVLVRYWGLEVMHKEKALAHIPLLEYGDPEEAEDDGALEFP